MSLDNIFQAIDAEIARLKNVRALLESSLTAGKNGQVKVGRTISKAARKRISKAQKKRWREQKARARLAAKK